MDQIIDQLNKSIVDARLSKLDIKEVDVLKAAFDNLSGPIEEGERGKITGDFIKSAYFKLEQAGIGKFALDSNSFQVIRRRDPVTAKFGDSWLRYGFNVSTIDGKETITPFAHINMYAFNNVPVDPMENLIAGYAQYRMKMEEIFQENNLQFTDAKRDWYTLGMIGDIWFLYRAEHVDGFLKWLKMNKPTDYESKLNTLKII